MFTRPSATLLVLLCGVSIVACGGNGGSVPDPSSCPGGCTVPDGVDLVDGVASDFLVAISTGLNEVMILNPNNGQLSLPLPADGGAVAFGQLSTFSFAPDGVHAVYSDGQDWVYGEVGVGINVGRPTFKALSVVAGKPGWVWWNSRSDRFFTDSGWFDPIAQTAVECAPRGSADRPAIAPSPDGRHYIFNCTDAYGALYEDSQLVGIAGIESEFTADGQFATAARTRSINVLGRAWWLSPTPQIPLPPAPVQIPAQMLASGAMMGAMEARRGSKAKKTANVGTVACVEWGPSPMEFTAVDANAYLDADPELPVTHWSAEDSGLMALEAGAVGATGQILAADTRSDELLVAVSIWSRGPTGPNGECVDEPHSVRLARLRADTGEVLARSERGVIAGEAPYSLAAAGRTRRPRYAATGTNIHIRWPFGDVPAEGVIASREGGVLARSGQGWIGFDDGGDMNVRGPSDWPAPDARQFFGTFSTSQAYDGVHRGGVCAVSENGARPKCLRVPAPPQIVSVGGHAATGFAHQTAAASIVQLSQAAGYPGSEVHAFGWGFGESGTIAIDGAAVPTGDIVSWAPNHIAFTVTEATPNGRVTVEGPGGIQADARPFYFTRTERRDNPWEGLPSPEITLKQGLNEVVHPGTLVSWDFNGFNLPPLGTSPSPVGAGLSDGASWLYLSKGYDEPWSDRIAAKIDRWLRPFEVRGEPGIVEATPGAWNMLGSSLYRDDHLQQFDTVIGQVTEVYLGRVFRMSENNQLVGETWAPRSSEQLPQARFGCPTESYQEASGASLAIRPFSQGKAHLVRILGLENDATPKFDEPNITPLPAGMTRMAVLPSEGTILLTGRAFDDPNLAAWVFDAKLDGVMPAETTGPGHTPLTHPVAVDVGPRRGFFAVEHPTVFGPDATALVHFDPQGTPTWSIADSPFNTVSKGWFNRGSKVRMFVFGPVIFAYDAVAREAVTLDTRADPLMWVPWSLPDDAPLAAVFIDTPRERVLFASPTELFEASVSDAGLGATTYLDTPELENLPINVALFGVGVLADGTIIASPKLTDGSPGKEGQPLPFGGLLVKRP